MTTAPATAPEFIYDAIRKMGVARGVGPDGRAWTLEFHERHADDSMSVVVVAPDGTTRRLTATEDDFAFGDESVTLRGAGAPALRMTDVYLKKLRGFTRGNIPTPDVPGPSLP
jgi:hypothetical protein